MAIYDVVVMGGGIFGLSIAWECTRRGARVGLFERDRIGAGASGGVVGALAPHVPDQWNAKKAVQFESLIAQRAFWDDIRAAGGVDPGYARLGRIQPIPNEAALDLARSRAAGARDLWQGLAEWRVVPAGDDGWSPPSPTGWMILDTLSARLHPRLAAAALVAAIRATGGEVHEGQALPPDGFAGPVIWATGAAGLEALSQELGRRIGSAVKGQAAVFACKADDRPQIYVEGLHVVPHVDGTVAIGSTSENTYDDPQGTDMQLEALIDRARALCPALRNAPVVERWAGLRPRARSRAPILGPWPGRRGHFVANGGFKIGFGMAPVVAGIMADLVLDGHDRIPPGMSVNDCL